MTIRVAINGFGRIGRNVLRAHYEYAKQHDVEIVAINSPGDLAVNAHLLKYDTVHGRFTTPVETDGKDMIVGGDRIHVFKTRDPRELPWADLGVDLVMECTGAFNSKEASMVHIESGAKKVLLSAPGKTADATVVYGVNQDVLKATDLVVSNASCTTNGLAPLVKPLQDKIGIEHGLMTTIHSYTNDQVLTDVYHKDLRRARAATHSMIPTKTGAAKAVGLVLPQLKGRLDGFAVRVPTINVSFVDLTFMAERATSIEEINAILIEHAKKGKRVVRLKGGDPFVFGRGSEEMEALKAKEIPVTEVPGITSAIAVPAAAGIPVTHRGKSRSFHVVTAHTKGTADSLPEGLKELVAVEGTLVFLMGMHQLSKLAGRLMEYGKSPETPAAVVQGNFDGKTVSVRGTLFDIAEKVKESGMQSPAVIVIGETAEMEL